MSAVDVLRIDATTTHAGLLARLKEWALRVEAKLRGVPDAEVIRVRLSEDMLPLRIATQGKTPVAVLTLLRVWPTLTPSVLNASGSGSLLFWQPIVGGVEVVLIEGLVGTGTEQYTCVFEVRY
jgi:hypothetical protein